MIVKAAVIRHAQAPLRIESLMLDDPRAAEVLVRLIASGIAQSDLDAIAGGGPIAYPFVGGSEGAGIVERVGEAVDDIVPGDAVILGTAFCGACAACRDGRPALCVQRDALNRSGTRRDGSTSLHADGVPIHGFFGGQSSFATHALCHASSAIKVADDTPLEVLACLGGALQVAASAIMHGLPFEAGGAIVITGAGAEGLVAAMTARAMGAKTIIVADPNEERRALASEIGATLTVHTDDDLAAVVRSLTGTGTRFALDTTGHAQAIDACLQSLSPGGTCGLLQPLPGGMPGADGRATEAYALLDLSRGAGSSQDVVRAMAGWHAEGRFPIEKLVAFFPFEHINDALQALATGAVVKPIVRFSIGGFGDLDRADSEGAAVQEPEPGEPDETAPDEREPAAVVSAG